MSKKAFFPALILLAAPLILLSGRPQSAPAQAKVFPGADESTPSIAHYFTWINNVGGGPPQAQTMINLEFFKWLKEEYGMRLDTYAFDAGILDGGGYFNLKSEKFLKNYPDGFGPVQKKAASLGIRLGVWLGPDGYGDTAEEERDRIEMLVSLCRDYNFRVFKMDLMLTNLRPEKQDSVIKALTACREYAPDLVVLNHRVEFGKAAPYVTTTLWNGDETYIDIHMTNTQTATHHRAGAIARGLVPDLKRLVEDHGVCLSSCLDYWEDDLVMQAFNRCLLLAPELYGNPWFLRDDEYPRLARLFNLHRRYRDILVKGMVLPEKSYGPNAVSRGDETTRFLTLSNLTWNPVRYEIRLDESIGLTKGGGVQVVQFHPVERHVGRFARGGTAVVEVLPFRTCLIMASTSPLQETVLAGCDYEIVQDVPGRDVRIKLLGFPGSRASVSLPSGRDAFSGARLDGRDIPELIGGRTVEIPFAGTSAIRPWHRKLADLQPAPVPGDAEALYEATCFAADNNALEVRSLERSGPTAVSQVRDARDAFLHHPSFNQRGVWDRFLFDGSPATAFNVNHRLRNFPVGALRIDFGRPTEVDELIIRLKDAQAVTDFLAGGEPAAQASADLRAWSPAGFSASGDGLKIALAGKAGFRYVRLARAPDRILEIEASRSGAPVDRTGWRASNLFGLYEKTPAAKAWTGTVVLEEAARGSYLAIPVAGRHGREGAVAALRIDGRLAGVTDRSPSFPTNVWEFRVEAKEANYTFYAPVTPDMVGRKIEVSVFGLNKDLLDLKPEAWITAYPIPYETKELVLRRVRG